MHTAFHVMRLLLEAGLPDCRTTALPPYRLAALPDIPDMPSIPETRACGLRNDPSEAGFVGSDIA
jgi:hypothetical protein